MTRVVTQRLRFSLHLLDDDGKLSVKEFGELINYSVTWAINSIPTASVVPAVGGSVREDGKVSMLYDDDFKSAVEHRKYVGIYVEVTKSTSDVDEGTRANVRNSFFPDTRGDAKPDQFGQERSTMVRVFKGYIVTDIFDRPHNSAGGVIHLVHWASDLNVLSVLNPKSHPSNPQDMAIQGVFYPDTNIATSINTESKGNASWISDGLTPIDYKNAWKDITKYSFDSVIKRAERLEANAQALNYGTYDKALLEKSKKAYNAIDGRALDFSDKLVKGISTLQSALISYMTRQQGNTWINTTLWNKLISQFASDFMFCVIPRVEDILLIPTPGAIIPERCLEITENDTIHVSKNLQTDTLLSAIWLLFPFTRHNTRGTKPTPSTVRTGQYPNPARTSGTIKAMSVPGWLMLDSRTLTLASRKKDTSNDKQGNEEDKKQKEALKKETEAIHTIMDDLAKYYFLSSVFRSRTAAFITPMRMDVCPGTMIKLKMPPDKMANIVGEKELDAEWIYGVVASVQMRGTVNGEMFSMFQLTNIRTDKEVSSEELNSQTAVFYENAWDGRHYVMYEIIEDIK